jgi:hypothetical protein
MCFCSTGELSFIPKNYRTHELNHDSSGEDLIPVASPPALSQMPGAVSFNPPAVGILKHLGCSTSRHCAISIKHMIRPA